MRSSRPWRRYATNTRGTGGTPWMPGGRFRRSTAAGTPLRLSCPGTARHHDFLRAPPRIRRRHRPQRGEEHRGVPRIAALCRRDRRGRLGKHGRHHGDRPALHRECHRRSVEGVRAAEAGRRGPCTPRRCTQRGLRRASDPGTRGGNRATPFRPRDGPRLHRPPPDVRVGKGDPPPLRNPLLPLSFSGIGDILAKMNRYSDLSARQMHGRGRKCGILDLTVRPAFAFLKTYFLRGGWLDGVEGLVISVTTALLTFTKYVKLRELERKRV